MITIIGLGVIGGSYALALKEAGLTDVSIKLYPGDRHEVLNETDHDKVFAELQEWMQSRF